MKFLNTLFLMLVFVSPSYTQSWWDEFCSEKYTYGDQNDNVIKKIISSSADPVNKAEALLVSAWGMLYQREHPDSIVCTLWTIQQDVISKSRSDNGIQDILKDDCFVPKFRALLDSVRTATYLTSFNYAKQKKDDLLGKIATMERSLPQFLKTCVDVSFKVSPDDKDIEFFIKIKDCKAELDNNGMPRGRVGYPDVYEALYDWYVNSVLKDLGKNVDKERTNTTMEIKGLADGYLVTGDLPLGFNFSIPRGKEFTYMGSDKIPVPSELDIELNKTIPLCGRSNMYLALARACLAENRLRRIASQISIVAQEFRDSGDDFRGVEIKITARGIIDELASAKFRESKSAQTKRELMQGGRH